MALVFNNSNGAYQAINNGRYPTTPSSSQVNMCFPTDLINNNRNYYITIQLCTYDRASVFSGPSLTPVNSVTLPIPLKINDAQTVTWQQESLTSLGLSVLQSLGQNFAPGITNFFEKLAGAAAGITPIISYTQGISVNPHLVMLFQTQNFKQHNLQWILAPNNASDSNSLQQIIKYLKNAMLPVKGDFILNYPMIAVPSLSVGDYTYNFKPCAIESISIDWSAGATPAFFQDQSPALVSLTMQLKEIELWFQGEV